MNPTLCRCCGARLIGLALWVPAALAAWGAAAPAQAQEARPLQPDAVEGPVDPRDWRNLVHLARQGGVPLEQLVPAIAKEIGIKIVVEPALLSKKTVYIIGKTDMPDPTGLGRGPGFWVHKDALKPILLAVLQVNNLGLARLIGKEQGVKGDLELFQLVQSAKLKEVAQDVYNVDNLKDVPPGMEFVSMVLHVQYADPQLVYRAIINLLSKPDGYAQPISGVNAILLSEYANNIQRLAKIVELIDKKPEERVIRFIDVYHVLPSELLDRFRDFYTDATRPTTAPQPGQPAAAADQIKMEADDPTGQIIFLGTEADFQKVKEVIEKLDREVPDLDRRRVHIYFARNQDALDLADTLNQLLSDISQDQQQAAPGVPRPADAGGGITLRADQVRIVADPVTNSLIVTASASDYRELTEILEKLDIRKPQVLIEAMFVEISQGDDLTLGIEIATLDEPGPRARGFAATSFGLSTLVDETGAAISGGGGTPAGRSPREAQGITAGIFKDTFFEVPVLLQAQANENSSNVLSVPRILTDSGEEARIVISREVPIRQFISTGTAGNEREDVRFEDAPIELTVRPLISENNLRLDLNVEVTDFVAGTGSANLPPQRTRRTLTQIITVPNNRLVILGGLTTSTTTERVAKIPLLGDIPFLGELFKFRVNENAQRNLYVFLTPRILRDELALKKATEEHRTDLKDRQLRLQGLDRFLDDRLDERSFVPSGRMPARQRFDLFGDGPSRRPADTE